MLPSPSVSVKIQIIGGKVYSKLWSYILLGGVNIFFVFKSLLRMPSNVLPLHLKQTFQLIIWIFIEGEGDGIESRLPFKIFSTLTKKCFIEASVSNFNCNDELSLSLSWVDCLLTDSEVFTLFAENSQIVLKISIIIIL